MIHAEHRGHLDVEALGHILRVKWGRGRDPELLSELITAWQDAVATHGSPPPQATVTLRPGEPQSALEQLSVSVTQRALLLAQGELLLLHAAGLADPSGRTLAFVAPSGTGKTTLSSILGRSLAYLSDETVGISADLRVHPYRKPLSVIRGGAYKTQLSPSRLGLNVGLHLEPRLAGVVLLRRRPQDEPWLPVSVRRIPFVETITALLPQTSYLDSLETPLQLIASILERTGGALALDYSEASDVLENYQDLFDAAPLRETWEPCLPASGRSRALDALSDGDCLLLFSRERQLLQLRGVGPLTWSLLANGESLEATVDAMVDRYGEPEHVQPRQVVQDIERELVEFGLLAP